VTRPQATALLADGVRLLAKYQDRLAAQDTFGVLLVLQGPHRAPGADRDGPGGLFRARPTSAVSGNHSSGSRHDVAHRACRYTRPSSSRSFGSPDRRCTGRGETVVTTGCTSSRSSPVQPHRRTARPHPPTGR